jgi:hypothetical protein
MNKNCKNTELNFGKMDYSDPSVQMDMLEAYEKIASTKHMDFPTSTNVWTAKYALWGTDYCKSSPYTCGRDWNCNANWVRRAKFSVQDLHLYTSIL